MAANTLAPSGFQTARQVTGGAANASMFEEFILFSYGTKIAYGDPVFRATDGTIRLYANGGTTCLGIFRGCHYLDPSTGKTEFRNQWSAPGNLASTTQVFALVDADPNMTFLVQGNGTAITQGDIGKNVDITTSSSGAPNGAGLSTCSVDVSTKATTATLPFRIRSIVTTPPSGASPAYVSTNDNQWLEVMINTSPMTTRTGQA